MTPSFFINKTIHNKTAPPSDWNTPDDAWDAILPFFPKDKTVWLPFYNDGYAGDYLADKGHSVIHRDEDFWVSNHGECVIDNPPYKVKGIVKVKLKIMERLIKLNKPFCLLMPTTTIQTKYFKELSDTHGRFQLIIPSGKIDFVNNYKQNAKCLFYTLWVCWGMGFDSDVNLV